ncbi:hypothetical protein F5B17DRAFT_403013 [Nemania serpens]|nr:hypothetical protein F5B17DRAFT_403013 [Nemania serpens]
MRRSWIVLCPRLIPSFIQYLEPVVCAASTLSRGAYNSRNAELRFSRLCWSMENIRDLYYLGPSPGIQRRLIAGRKDACSEPAVARPTHRIASIQPACNSALRRFHQFRVYAMRPYTRW